MKTPQVSNKEIAEYKLLSDFTDYLLDYKGGIYIDSLVIDEFLKQRKK